MFGMIEMLGQTAPTANVMDRSLVNKSRSKSYEELIIEKGVLTIFKALVKNCSSVIYKVSYNVQLAYINVKTFSE
jgi:hypothetical protein